MQPLVSSTIFSTLARPVTTLPSIPTSPISFMMTATGFPRSPCSSTWRRSVVFPLPRKPVRMSTATVRIRRLSGWPWRLRRTIRGLRAACSLLPPAACLQARLVGRRCACRSRSPARSPRSPWLPGQTPRSPWALLGAEDAGGEEERVRVADGAGPHLPLARRLDRAHRDRLADGRRRVGRRVVAGVAESGLELVARPEPRRGHRLQANAVEDVVARDHRRVSRVEHHTHERNGTGLHDLDELAEAELAGGEPRQHGEALVRRVPHGHRALGARDHAVAREAARKRARLGPERGTIAPPPPPAQPLSAAWGA